MLARSSVLILAFSAFASHAAAIELDESGLAFNSLIDYYGLTNDSDYNARISEALQHQLGDYNAFMPANQTKSLGNDDQSFWGLASLSAHEAQLPAPASGSWLEFAQNVFDTQAARWDTESCGGGLKWQIFTFNNGYNYKNSASNSQMFLLAARLAEQTSNATYAEWANKVYTWCTDIGLVTAYQRVFDGTDDKQNCSSVNRIQITSNHATFTEGAALMYKLSNASQNWTDIVTGFVNASSVFTGDNGALVEVACEKKGNCDIDQRAFKGIAMRSYARAAQVASIVRDSLHYLLVASAKGAASNCEGSGDNVACGLNWSNSSESIWEKATAADGNLGETLNALQAIQGSLWPVIDSEAGTVNGTVGSGSPNGTTSGTPSGSSGSAAQPTGAGATLVASLTFILVVAFASALSC
ncbi:glycoside hydrolase [Lizonia empirigonia]|nr:glycoside hydrolase [Lizonia empirigonia]